MAERRTAIERAVLDDGVSLAAAIRTHAVDQIGRLVDALGAELTRMEASTEAGERLDTAAALRVARAWRQLAPLLELRDETAPKAAPTPVPQSLAARIAAQSNDAPAPVLNGHTPADA